MGQRQGRKSGNMTVKWASMITMFSNRRLNISLPRSAWNERKSGCFGHKKVHIFIYKVERAARLLGLDSPTKLTIFPLPFRASVYNSDISERSSIAYLHKCWIWITYQITLMKWIFSTTSLAQCFRHSTTSACICDLNSFSSHWNIYRGESE